jgi:PTH1 family peptidyl-tRNA hydrolase
MNISGPSIAAAFRKTVQSPTSLIIITDSLSHKPETLSVKLGGSANGHNGVKSIISALGGETGFYRFRVGIGRDESDPADYVMRKLSSHERQFWDDQGLDLVLSEIEKVTHKNLANG